MGHGLPRHHRPGKVRSRFSEETFAGVPSRDGIAPKPDIDLAAGHRVRSTHGADLHGLAGERVG